MAKSTDRTARSSSNKSTPGRKGAGSGDSRRKILKGTLAGVGAIGASGRLPTSWVKPATESALLPAHAESSPPPCGIRGEAFFLADDTWNGSSLRTQSYPFECGDRLQNVEVTESSCNYNVSLIFLNLALDRAPGAAGTGTVGLQTNLGSWDQNSPVNFPVNANLTNYSIPIVAGGGYADPQADVSITVDIPGFSTARLRLNFFCED